MAGDLPGKSCIVTGSSSGLGRTIALSFAHHNAAYVLCVDLHPEAPAQPAAATSIEPEDEDLLSSRPTHEILIN